jgi:hypothetical protein
MTSKRVKRVNKKYLTFSIQIFGEDSLHTLYFQRKKLKSCFDENSRVY